MSTMKVLNMAGAEVGTVELNDAIFNLAWRQIFQGTMWALGAVKLDIGGKATLESRL